MGRAGRAGSPRTRTATGRRCPPRTRPSRSGPPRRPRPWARIARTRGRGRSGRDPRRPRTGAATACRFAGPTRAPRPSSSAGGARRQACTAREGEMSEHRVREPLGLGRSGTAATDLLAVRVQADDVPRAELEGIPALVRDAGRRHRSSRSTPAAPAVSYSWLPGTGDRAVLVPAPRRVVAVREFLGGSALVGQVAQGEDGAPLRNQLVQQRRRGLVPVGVAVGDVARRQNLHRSGRAGRRQRRCRRQRTDRWRGAARWLTGWLAGSRTSCEKGWGGGGGRV